jgi:hypothetical protein
LYVYSRDVPKEDAFFLSASKEAAKARFVGDLDPVAVHVKRKPDSSIVEDCLLHRIPPLPIRSDSTPGYTNGE